MNSIILGLKDFSEIILFNPLIHRFRNVGTTWGGDLFRLTQFLSTRSKARALVPNSLSYRPFFVYHVKLNIPLKWPNWNLRMFTLSMNPVEVNLAGSVI